jgi:hypothetical protein
VSGGFDDNLGAVVHWLGTSQELER